jgi:hypothetical protein
MIFQYFAPATCTCQVRLISLLSHQEPTHKGTADDLPSASKMISVDLRLSTVSYFHKQVSIPPSQYQNDCGSSTPTPTITTMQSTSSTILLIYAVVLAMLASIISAAALPELPCLPTGGSTALPDHPCLLTSGGPTSTSETDTDTKLEIPTFPPVALTVYGSPNCPYTSTLNVSTLTAGTCYPLRSASISAYLTAAPSEGYYCNFALHQTADCSGDTPVMSQNFTTKYAGVCYDDADLGYATNGSLEAGNSVWYACYAYDQ